MLLEGRIAIVAGAGPGLGPDIALLFAQHGADLLLAARRTESCAAVVDQVRTLGRQAEVVEVDNADAESCRVVAKTCQERYGRIDVLVNNGFDDGLPLTVDPDDIDEWRRVMEQNLWAALHMNRAVLTGMKEQKRGRIVMVNAMAPWRHDADHEAYAVVCAALETVIRTTAREVGPFGIRVNGIHPGHVWGPLVKAGLRRLALERGTTPEAIYMEIAGSNCLGYLPRPAEVAGSVLYLASDLSRPVTGQCLGVNAGQMPFY